MVVVVVIAVAVSVVPMTPVIVAVVISAPAGMNSGMTGMGVTSLRRSNSEDDYQDKAQRFYDSHAIYDYSVDWRWTLEVFDFVSRKTRRELRTMIESMLPST